LKQVLVATDAWRPQINGVVRSLEHVARHAENLDHRLEFVSPLDFRTLPLPGYPEIRLALAGAGALVRRIENMAPDLIHIATEGPIGLAARRACLRLGLPFTTSYHTRFPEYLRARLPVPLAVSYGWLRRFHNAGSGVMVSTQTLEDTLTGRGFRRVMRWSRGVDTSLFRPRPGACLGLKRPVFLYVGRLAVEKNIAAFLSLDLPGTKLVVGDGPARAALAAAFPEAVFLGSRTGEALAEVYAASDVFVFPSLTDTFGIVLLEALASGLPVAAYPVMGPIDVIADTGCGVLDSDLGRAARACLDLPREPCRALALRYDWRESARQFLANLHQAQDEPARKARLRQRLRRHMAAAAGRLVR
jgi:glycosyltransferase involved in cell wall biosynthesis